VYSQKLNGLEGSGDSGTGISITDAFDTIKLWHRNKAIDPITGYKRPTVVNMSWGYLTGYDTVSSLTYRGVSYTDGTTTGSELYRQSVYGLMDISGANIGTTFATNVRISSVDTDVNELIAEGVHVCIAAGNRGHKIDLPGGTDYDNFVVTNASTTYYHRGSSPSSVNAICVGNIDSTPYSGGELDQKAISSETGPGVDIYAPGTNIMSACSNTNAFSAQNYYLNASFRQVNISGTSMASPQVAGIAALLLEINPGATPSQVKASLLANTGTAIYTSESGSDWGNRRSLYGGEPTVLYNKFNQDVSTTVSGEFVKLANIGV
jgi:subtilisin family serine protease